jgi:molybdenum cofactor synthesis domain-containing protein
MISLADARRQVLDRCPPREGRSMPTSEALGCVVTEPVVSTESVPPFANSAMDGYAVRAADTEGAGEYQPQRLHVVGTLAAGDPPAFAVAEGEAVRIMTGAPMPRGADAVVMVEQTRRLRVAREGPDRGKDLVDVLAPVEAGRSIRHAGDDIAPGDEVLAAGTVIGPAHLGVLASIGCTDVVAVPRLRVGVLSTGDELVQGGRRLLPGQIRESNKPMLLALVARTGCEPVDLGLVPDDEKFLEAALRSGAANCDAMITSGGVSMGDFDVVKAVLDRIAGMAWMQIAIKPAKPFAFGEVDGTPVFGLPGNPVSSLVSFEVLARPALRQMMAQPQIDRPRVVAQVGAPLKRRPDGKEHLQRVVVRWSDGDFHADPITAQGSHQLAASAGANGLAVLPDGEGVALGEAVEVILFDDLPLLTGIVG